MCVFNSNQESRVQKGLNQIVSLCWVFSHGSSGVVGVVQRGGGQIQISPKQIFYIYQYMIMGGGGERNFPQQKGVVMIFSGISSVALWF
jgi:hypothetical protein